MEYTCAVPRGGRLAEQSLLTGPKEASSSKVSIYDMGGGTFGTSFSTIENGTFEVNPMAERGLRQPDRGCPHAGFQKEK